jgi:hypothetical protein
MSYGHQHTEQNTKQHTKLVVGMFASLACLALSGWIGWRIAPVAAATPGTLGTKMVYIDAQYRVDPVTITKVIVGGQQIEPGVSVGPREDKPGTPFQADEDWLKNMSIFLKNRTDKAIVRAEVQLFFPDTGDGSGARSVTAYTMTLGQLPEIDAFTSHGQKLPPEPDKHPILFAPGQTLVVQVADYIDPIQSFVEQKLSFSQVTRVAIRRLQFYFEDGTRWNDLVGFGIPDPNHPGQFTNMDRNTYFPGNPRQNWPPSESWTPPGKESKKP